MTTRNRSAASKKGYQTYLRKQRASIRRQLQRVKDRKNEARRIRGRRQRALDRVSMSYSTTPKWDIRRFLGELDGWTCQICGKTLSPYARWGWNGERCPDWWTDDFPVLDHIRPRNNTPEMTRERLDDISNLRLCCSRCNFCRFALDPENKNPEWVNKAIPQLKCSQFVWESDPYKFVEGSSLTVRWIKPKFLDKSLSWWKQYTFHFRREIPHE